VNKQYEGMFVVSPAVGDGDKALEPVQRVLDRAGAEVLVCKRWDERKLAYEIAGQKRGIYVLTYFKADGDRITDIERDVQLSEQILRVLVLQAGDLTAEVMNTPTPAETGHSPSGDLSGPPDRDRDRGRRDGRPRSSGESFHGGRGESRPPRPAGRPQAESPARSESADQSESTDQSGSADQSEPDRHGGESSQ